MTVALPSHRFARRACRITLRGTVQGVGMRPWLARHATRLSLDGAVHNARGGVELTVEGAPSAVDELLTRLHSAPPVGADIHRIDCTDIAPGNTEHGFHIHDDIRSDDAATTGVRPDTAPCADCVAEIFDPENRRFRHALNSCNSCGPRASIQQRSIWARAHTTNAPLPPCPGCELEFGTASDRRFHSEGINCPACAPPPVLSRTDHRTFALEALTSFDAVDAVASLIQRGELVAVQGVTGFHIACDARNPDAIARLRTLKQRPAKPLALMARNVEMIERYAQVSAHEAAALQSPAAPIVLLARRGDCDDPLPDSIAPLLDTLGVMLPASALHHLMLLRLQAPVVMTSANRRGAPLCTSADEVSAQLSEGCEWVLSYARTIAGPADDSVVAMDGARQVILRHGRGLAPVTVALPAGLRSSVAVLASGGPWKSAGAIAQNGMATLSPQLPALENPDMHSRFRDNQKRLVALHQSAAGRLARDNHPDCPAAALSRDVIGEIPQLEVQHHHAHAAACMVDNAIENDGEARLAVVFDGIGYGDDNSFWGGEFLLADYGDYQRIAALPSVALPGGALAAAEPWRNLWAHLVAATNADDPLQRFAALPAIQSLQQRPLQQLQRALERGINSPPASSAGRLFDAVAALLELAPEQQQFEAQAALLLEQAAHRASTAARAYPIALTETAAQLRWNLAPLWRGLAEDVSAGTPAATIALGFHQSLAAAIAATATAIRARHGAAWRNNDVLLSGGVFQNRLLSRLCRDALSAAGFRVLEHHRIPANDGGLPIGQAAVAIARQRREGLH